MGALHAGHAALIRKARKVAGESGTVAVSIFVNPTQFRPGEDLSAYPRPFVSDRGLCRAMGVDLVFHPSAEEMYPEGFSTYVEETGISSVLCGSSRPGHFRGVCTVVTKLLNIMAPDAAIFGRKDFQQLAIIRRMVRDLNLPVSIIGLNTVRERDGLALSSRNSYLNAAERAQAPVLHEALLAAAELARRGASARNIRARVSRMVARASLARIDYVEVVDPVSLRPSRQPKEQSLVVMAVFFGRTRLIDNMLVSNHSKASLSPL